MKVFVSWSGPVSKQIAEQMREWLKSVIQTLDPWLSSEDIDKGTRWSAAIQKELSESKAAVFCLTPDNVESAWLNFEAGAVSNTDWTSHVCTYLLGLTGSSVTGPLTQFQHTLANRDDTWRLIKTLNSAQGKAEALDEKVLEKSFNAFWPELERELARIAEIEQPAKVKRSTQDIAEETLNIVRDLQRDSQTARKEASAQLDDRFSKVRLDKVIYEIAHIANRQQGQLDELRHELRSKTTAQQPDPLPEKSKE